VPVLAMAAGLVFMVVAALVLARGGNGEEPAVDPSAITVSARDISVVTQVYEPGQTSGWHSHSGIHAVAVTSGVLTVHVSGCPARTFEPGRPYVGGQEPHLVANEGDVPVTMTVTYLNPTSPAAQGTAPSGCPAA
jgi:quercetin dioxygenase-like cupin family protein